MRKPMRSSALFIGICTLLVGATADAANWSGNVKIAAIEVSNVSTGGVWLSFTTPPYPSHPCAVQNGQYVLGGGIANVNKMTSVATEALENSRNIRVYWSGACSTGAGGGYPILLGITLK